MALEPEQRSRIVEMYKAGAKTAEITKATGANRSTIYFVLNSEGVTPSRQTMPVPATVRPPASGQAPLLDWALARLVELENENGQLRERMRLAREGLTE